MEAAYPTCGLTRQEQKEILRANMPGYDPKRHDGYWYEYVKSVDDAARNAWIEKRMKANV